MTDKPTFIQFYNTYQQWYTVNIEAIVLIKNRTIFFSNGTSTSIDHRTETALFDWLTKHGKLYRLEEET